MYVIIEILSEITAGSLMVGTPINLIQRPISPGLIKDLWIKPLRPKTSEMAKGHERKVEPPGIEPRAIGLMRQCSATKLQLPPVTTPCHHWTPSCDLAQDLNDHNHNAANIIINHILYMFVNIMLSF